jgi:hypothetical protein
LISSGDELPSDSKFVRYVGFNKMEKDEADQVLGPSIDAFMLKDSHDYLSVTWCEYFEGSAEEQLRCAIEAIRKSKVDVRPKACFCITTAQSLASAISESGRTFRAVFWPEDDNPAHSGVYGTSDEDLLLLSKLASEIWRDFLTREEANLLRLGPCNVSSLVNTSAAT